MAEPQNTTVAALLGAVPGPLGVIGSGVYAGSKGESLGQGFRGAGSSVLGQVGGGLLGAGLGGIGGAGLGALLRALSGEEGAGAGGGLASGGLGAYLGGTLGAPLGGAYMANRSAKKYNGKLDRYRKHQKSLSGGSTVNVYAGGEREKPREDETEKEANWGQRTSNMVGRFFNRGNTPPPLPPLLPGGGMRRQPPPLTARQRANSWVSGKKPVVQAGVLGLGLGELHGQISGNARGQHEGAAKAIHQFENMPGWQHGLMALSGLVGQRGALTDYGLGRAHKRQQNAGFWERMTGPDYLDLQSRTRDMRAAKPNPMQQRIASWFQ